MRPYLILSMALLAATPAARAQTAARFDGGMAVLTDTTNGWSRLDLQFEYFFGPPFSFPLQFDMPWPGSLSQIVTTNLFNGAVGAAGFAGAGTGPFRAGEFSWLMDQTTLVGHVDPDPLNYMIVSNKCEPLTPSGYRVDGRPYYGAAWAEFTGYFDTCAPGSYVQMSMVIPHASFMPGADLVTPEPSSLALMVTGLAGVGAFFRRKRFAAA